MVQRLDSRCVSTMGAWGPNQNTPESSMKKFKPHYTYDFFFKGLWICARGEEGLATLSLIGPVILYVTEPCTCMDKARAKHVPCAVVSTVAITIVWYGRGGPAARPMGMYCCCMFECGHRRWEHKLRTPRLIASVSCAAAASGAPVASTVLYCYTRFTLPTSYAHVQLPLSLPRVFSACAPPHLMLCEPIACE